MNDCSQITQRLSASRQFFLFVFLSKQESSAGESFSRNVAGSSMQITGQHIKSTVQRRRSLHTYRFFISFD